MLDLEAIRRTRVVREPFAHFTVSDTLSADALAAIRADFPAITHPGIFPLSELAYGPAFAALIEDIRSADLEAILSEKFDVDLSDRPLMITVRGHCRASDGRIHTDSTSKVVTCLLYLNEPWAEDGGRLRLLRDPDDIDSVIVEVPPDGGTFVAFRRTDNSWHGHKPFEGPRRYVMFNWVTSQAAHDREIGRHRLSARLKRLNPFV
ncbi:2-oxoglutarate-Fe(II)-dependent oxygenase superfamily protein [Tepidamorphus gemmatus]|jgi:SM-20-related protein|uniref:2-oxoglutarate-Fe(II)-dependent oxygenase superfamily protein n=1 Tax=Tepidamorphus gemmatus TaxID=747076 RepID=A0A4R3LZT9_9HYPH|nr:2OG-Fe(II) oxygenase [Tepidamorphus gemmatus]TCT05836.1 2-oxoglutarate-Fe(II)-dependent oxygenase superfamily protein [Tepidamorphus gemmatus]